MGEEQIFIETEPQERISQLEKQVAELLSQITAIQKTTVDWHSAIFGAVNLILKPYSSELTLEREHLLNLMPSRIDCVIIKKNGNLHIDLDAFRLLRKYNIFEFKSYRDALDENVLWHTVSYAAAYKALEPNVGADEITITILRSSFPRKLLHDLAGLGWTVEEPYRNIFYLSGKVDIPIQIIVAKDLGEAYLPLQILTGRAKEADVRKFVDYYENLHDASDRKFADAILWACSEGNAELFRKLKEDEKMNGVLRDIMKEDLIRERQEGMREGKREGMREGKREGMREGAAGAFNAVAESMIYDGMPGEKIAQFTKLGRKDIDTIAHRLKRTVNWGDAARV